MRIEAVLIKDGLNGDLFEKENKTDSNACNYSFIKIRVDPKDPRNKFRGDDRIPKDFCLVKQGFVCLNMNENRNSGDLGEDKSED